MPVGHRGSGNKSIMKLSSAFCWPQSFSLGRRALRPAPPETIRIASAKDGNIRLGACGDPLTARQPGEPSIEVSELRARSKARSRSARQRDIIVSDWLWVSRERGLGAKLTFYPYSSALGAVMVPEFIFDPDVGGSQRPQTRRRRRPDRQKLAACCGH